MSGQWPPDWGESDDDVRAETEQADAEADARMSEVTAYLAALPGPVLPDAVEAQISAAIAAEATARAQANAQAVNATTGGRTLGRPPRRPKVRRSGKFRIRAISSVAAVLVLAVFGYLLKLGIGSSSSSSSAPDTFAAAPAASAEHKEAGASKSGESLSAPLPAEAKPSGAASVSFTVTDRGDAYQKSTLVSLVRERLAASRQTKSALGIPVGSTPPTALVGCVLHLTGNTVPRLVDEATYAGKPVYVIAVSNRAWVVGRGCTATHPELITSVSLTGISAP